MDPPLARRLLLPSTIRLYLLQIGAFNATAYLPLSRRWFSFSVVRFYLPQIEAFNALVEPRLPGDGSLPRSYTCIYHKFGHLMPLSNPPTLLEIARSLKLVGDRANLHCTSPSAVDLAI